MQIRRFFCPELNAHDEVALLGEKETQHALRVLRLSDGDRLQLLNGRGVIADAELQNCGNGGRRVKEAQCRILECREVASPKSPLTLCVAPPRGKNFDLVLKSATELGVSAIQPILCRYGVARPEDISENWHDVLVSALKQSANPWMPQLLTVKSFEEALAETQSQLGVFGASPAAEKTAQRPLSTEIACQARYLWIGPEGGFEHQEESSLIEAGNVPVTIGNCILRVETAVPAMLGFLEARRRKPEL